MKLIGQMTLFLMSLGALAASGNKVQIDIKDLDYKVPENNRGNGGTLIFPHVRLTWDDLKLSLENTSQFLDANIKVRPTYLKFITPGVKMNLPLERDSMFFNIKNIKLTDSIYLMNSDYFSFSGEAFSIQYDASKLFLDKYSLFCDGPEGVDMTTLSGMKHGCLHDMALTGRDEGELAGARIEYKDSLESGEDFTLSTILESFTLKQNKFKLILDDGSLDITNYDIDANHAEVTCSKNPDVFAFEAQDITGLKNSCVNEINIVAKNIRIKDTESETIFYINLESLVTEDGLIKAFLPQVIMADKEKAIQLEAINITCNRNENAEFYDLQKIIAGCLDGGLIEIKNIRMVDLNSSSAYKKLDDVNSSVGRDQSEPMFQELNVKLTNTRTNMSAKVKYGFLPKFNTELKGHFLHEPEDELLTLFIDDYTAFKFFGEGILTRGLVNLLGQAILNSNDNAEMDYPEIKYSFKKKE